MESPIHKTPAIVLSSVKYGDHGNVVRMFTPDHGLVAFMVHSLRSKKGGKMRPSMVLPMSLLEIVIQPKSKGSLKSIQEAHPLEHWQSLHTDPIKMTLCTFAAEIIQKSISEGHPDEHFFNRVWEWLKEMDTDRAQMSIATHQLLLFICRHLGCYPHFETYRENFVFDMIDGCFVPEAPDHKYWLTERESVALKRLVEGEKPSKEIRQRLLDELLGYIRIHHEAFGTIKSLEILRTLLA